LRLRLKLQIYSIKYKKDFLIGREVSIKYIRGGEEKVVGVGRSKMENGKHGNLASRRG
jgi:hypothetical protein